MNNDDFLNYEQIRQRYAMESCIRSIQKEKPLILKGGTALMLAYGLNRFSEDLDFDIAQTFTGKGTINLQHTLEKALPVEFKLIDINLKKYTEKVSRYMLYYNDLETQNLNTLKIEISYRTPVVDSDIYHKNNMKFLSIEKIASFKIGALLDSDIQERTKARDLFDAHFLLANYQQQIPKTLLNKILTIDLTSLESRYRNSFYEDEIFLKRGITAEDIVIGLMSIIEKIQKHQQKIQSFRRY